MARGHGHRLNRRPWRGPMGGIEPLEGRQFLSLPPALEPLPGSSAVPGFAGGQAEIGPAVNRTPAFDSQDLPVDVWIVVPDFAGAAAYRGGGAAEQLAPAPDTATQGQIVNDASTAARLFAFASIDGSEWTPRPSLLEADGRPPLVSTGYADAQTSPTANRLNVVLPNGLLPDVRPPANDSSDVAWRTENHGGADMAPAVGSPPVSAANSPVAANPKVESLAERVYEEPSVAAADGLAEIASSDYLVATEAGGAKIAANVAGQPTSEPERSVFDDLLMPRLTIDPAAIGVALGDLFAEAEEAGLDLLGILTDSIGTAELAAATGLVAAGLAARRVYVGESRRRAERRRLLAGRFIDGPESLRLV